MRLRGLKPRSKPWANIHYYHSSPWRPSPFLACKLSHGCKRMSRIDLLNTILFPVTFLWERKNLRVWFHHWSLSEKLDAAVFRSNFCQRNARVKVKLGHNRLKLSCCFIILVTAEGSLLGLALSGHGLDGFLDGLLVSQELKVQRTGIRNYGC